MRVLLAAVVCQPWLFQATCHPYTHRAVIQPSDHFASSALIAQYKIEVCPARQTSRLLRRRRLISQISSGTMHVLRLGVPIGQAIAIHEWEFADGTRGGPIAEANAVDQRSNDAAPSEAHVQAGQDLLSWVKASCCTSHTACG